MNESNFVASLRLEEWWTVFGQAFFDTAKNKAPEWVAQDISEKRLNDIAKQIGIDPSKNHFVRWAQSTGLATTYFADHERTISASKIKEELYSIEVALDNLANHLRDAHLYSLFYLNSKRTELYNRGRIVDDTATDHFLTIIGDYRSRFKGKDGIVRSNRDNWSSARFAVFNLFCLIHDCMDIDEVDVKGEHLRLLAHAVVTPAYDQMGQDGKAVDVPYLVRETLKDAERLANASGF